jgi:hypothetical protein
MRKALNFMLLWLVLFLAFQVSACKSVQKTVKEEPGKAAVTASQTDTTEKGTGKAKAGSAETSKKKAGSAETSKKKAGSTETGKSKQGTLAGLEKKLKTKAEKILSPSVRKAILPSGVVLLILISLLSSRKERDVNKRKKRIYESASP